MLRVPVMLPLQPQTSRKVDCRRVVAGGRLAAADRVRMWCVCSVTVVARRAMSANSFVRTGHASGVQQVRSNAREAVTPSCSRVLLSTSTADTVADRQYAFGPSV